MYDFCRMMCCRVMKENRGVFDRIASGRCSRLFCEIFSGVLLLFCFGAAAHSSAAMSFKTDGSLIEMENSIIRLEIDKNSGAILKIFYKGVNLVGSGKGYMQSDDENGVLSPKQTKLIIARNDDEVMDIGFAHQHVFAVDYEVHYVLRPGEEGFYNYIVYGSKADNPGKHIFSQLNYALRLDPALFTHFFDGTNRGVFPTPQVLGAGKAVMGCHL